jgi:hypothetical protein
MMVNDEPRLAEGTLAIALEAANGEDVAHNTTKFYLVPLGVHHIESAYTVDRWQVPAQGYRGGNWRAIRRANGKPQASQHSRAETEYELVPCSVRSLVVSGPPSPVFPVPKLDRLRRRC